MRERLGMGLIPLDSSLRRTMTLLRRNTIVAFLGDRPQREGGVAVTFFGAEAWLPGLDPRVSRSAAVRR